MALCVSCSTRNAPQMSESKSSATSQRNGKSTKRKSKCLCQEATIGIGIATIPETEADTETILLVVSRVIEIGMVETMMIGGVLEILLEDLLQTESEDPQETGMIGLVTEIVTLIAIDREREIVIEMAGMMTGARQEMIIENGIDMIGETGEEMMIGGGHTMMMIGGEIGGDESMRLCLERDYT